MREIKHYDSLDDIVDSVAESNEVTGVYSSAIEEDVGFLKIIASPFYSTLE